MSGCDARSRPVSKQQEHKPENEDDALQFHNDANTQRDPKSFDTRVSPSGFACIQPVGTGSNLQIFNIEENRIWDD